MVRNPSLFPAPAVLLVCLHIFFGTGGANAQSRDTTGPTSGRIVLIEPKHPKGALKVTQAKGVRPVNAFEGMLIRRGYVLTLRPAAGAAVICGDGRKHELVPGPQGCPCTMPCTPEICGINYDGSTVGSMRGTDTGKGVFPVVIAPRKTMVVNLRPMIRWSPIAGAKQGTTYNVTLYGDGMKALWSKDVVSQTRLAYPDDERPLMPGQTYIVVVTSEGASSQQDHSPWLGFTTLTPEQARTFAEAEMKRRQLGLADPQTRLLVSNLYAARGLYAEAIEQLEELYATRKEPVVARTLGDLYAEVGLNREAEKKYLEALDLTPAGDLDGLGLTQRNLAQVYESLGVFEKAITRLRAAAGAYRRLGNTARVNALLNEERRLKKNRRQS